MSDPIAGRVVWVTGAGSGVGEAAALALAGAGARLVLSGRRVEPLESLATSIRERGGEAHVAPLDIADGATVDRAAAFVADTCGRCDIVVNSAGLNVPNRSWSRLDAAAVDLVLGADLTGPFHLTRAILPVMRAAGGGLFIHIASWASRYVSPLTGPAYAAAKHGLLAMSESLNQEECQNGIRSCCICPGEIATPLLAKRPVPVPQEEVARMLQPRDLADTVLFVARMPATVCINEVLMSPTWNRGYVAALRAR
jgi:NADP-dependent 3-hydroxy acid dehydrogenase YdfG